MAAMDLKWLMSEEVLSNVFSHFDISNKGFISIEDLHNAVSKTVDQEVTITDVQNFTRRNSLSGKINYDTFRSVML